jgi:hypothetical protein
MEYLFNIFTKLKTFFNYLKNKFRMNVFNLLDAFNEQFGQWYYFDINIKTTDGKNEYKFPVVCCMREKTHAESLLNQITKDLTTHFNVVGTSITQLTTHEKDGKIRQLELEYANQDIVELNVLIYKVVGQRPKPQDIELLHNPDLSVDNFDIQNDYKHERTIKFKVKQIQNQGVPYNQIKDFFIVKIDKSKLD